MRRAAWLLGMGCGVGLAVGRPAEGDPLGARLTVAQAEVAAGRDLEAQAEGELRSLAGTAGSHVAAELEAALRQTERMARATALRTLAERTEAMRGLGPPGVAPGAARATLERVLARREFAGRDREDGLAERAPTWLRDLAERWLDWFAAHGRDPGSRMPFPGLGVAALPMALALLGLLLGAVLAMAYRWLRSPAPELPTPDAAPVARGIGAEALERARDDWLRSVEERVHVGDLPGALRAVYLAVLVSVHQARILDVRPERTTGEHVTALTRARPAAAAAFSELTLVFEHVVYGARRITAAELGSARLLAERVVQAARAVR